MSETAEFSLTDHLSQEAHAMGDGGGFSLADHLADEAHTMPAYDPSRGVEGLAEASGRQAVHQYQAGGQTLNSEQQDSIMRAHRQVYGVNPGRSLGEDLADTARESAKTNTFMENAGPRIAEGNAALATSLVGTVAPKTAADMRQNVQSAYGTPQEGSWGNLAGKVRGTSDSVAGVMAAGEMAPELMGAQGFGEGRIAATEARRAGANVSGAQEAALAALQAGIGYAAGKVTFGETVPGIQRVLPTSVIKATTPEVGNMIVPTLARGAGRAVVGAADMTAAQLANTAAAGAVMGGAHGTGEAIKHPAAMEHLAGVAKEMTAEQARLALNDDLNGQKAVKPALDALLAAQRQKESLTPERAGAASNAPPAPASPPTQETPHEAQAQPQETRQVPRQEAPPQAAAAQPENRPVAARVEELRAQKQETPQPAPTPDNPLGTQKASTREQLVSRYKPGNPFAEKAAIAREKADRLNAPTARDQAMRESFPLGGGFGNSQGRKAFNASFGRAAEAVKWSKEAAMRENQARAFDEGKINWQGRSIEKFAKTPPTNQSGGVNETSPEKPSPPAPVPEARPQQEVPQQDQNVPEKKQDAAHGGEATTTQVENPRIENLVEAMRPKPLEIVQRNKLKGSDGKWYAGGGFPRGVEPTGEAEPYFVRQTPEGTTVGKQFPTREAGLADLAESQKTRDAESRAALQGMNEEQLQSQEKYWLKQEAKPSKPIATKPVAKAPEPTAPRRTRKLMTAGSVSDFEAGRDKVVREGDRTFIVDTRGERAKMEVQSDVFNEENKANLSKLNPSQLDRMKQEVQRTPYLSDEGKSERLDYIRKMQFPDLKPTPPAAGTSGAAGEGAGKSSKAAEAGQAPPDKAADVAARVEALRGKKQAEQPTQESPNETATENLSVKDARRLKGKTDLSDEPRRDSYGRPIETVRAAEAKNGKITRYERHPIEYPDLKVGDTPAQHLDLREKGNASAVVTAYELLGDRARSNVSEASLKAVDAAYRADMIPVLDPTGHKDTQLWAKAGREDDMRALARKMDKVKDTDPYTVSMANPKTAPFREPPRPFKDEATKMKAIKDMAADAPINHVGRVDGYRVSEDGTTLEVTDGTTASIIKRNKGGWGEDGIFDKAGKKVEGDEAKYPAVKDYQPKKAPIAKLFGEDVGRLFRKLRQIEHMTSDEYPGVIALLNEDGSIGFATMQPGMGVAEVGISTKGTPKELGIINPTKVREMLEFHARMQPNVKGVRGTQLSEIYWDAPDQPMFLRTYRADSQITSAIAPMKPEKGFTFGDVHEMMMEKGKPFSEPEGDKTAQAEPLAGKSIGPGAAASVDPAFRAIAGEHEPVPEDAPRIIKAVTAEPADAARKATIIGRLLQGAADAYEGRSSAVKEAFTAAKDELARLGQQAFPALNRNEPKASSAASALTAIPETKAAMLDEWQSHLKAIAKNNGTPLEEFKTLVGAAMSEDQLRGVRDREVQNATAAKAERDRLMDEADDLDKRGESGQAANLNAKIDEQDALYEQATEAAKKVKTLIGAEGSPFKTEADYKAAQEHPAVQEAAAYFRQAVEPALTDFYKSSSKWNATDDEGNPVEPPTRGKDFGLHMSLNPIMGEEGGAAGTKLKAGGNIRNTLEKHSILEKKATGAADSYEMDLFKNIENALNKSILPGTHARFYQSLQDAGLAIEGKSGDRPVLDNKPTVPFDLRFKPGAKLFVRADVAGEVRNALAIDRPDKPFRTIGNLSTRVQLASGLEAMGHIANQLYGLVSKPLAGGVLAESAERVSPALGKAVRVAENLPVAKVVGILDSVGTKAYRLAFNNLNLKEQITSLARAGALQPGHDGSKFNPLTWLGKGVKGLTNSMRLALDDGFKMAVDANIGIKNTEANRRDYINQAGNYHRESSATIVRWLKDSSLGPFATAGSARVAQGYRVLAGFAPGVQGSFKARSLMRINGAAQVAGLLAGVGILNYMRTGKMQPAGTPIGSLYLGDDKDGRPKYEDVADLIGVRGAMRNVGADALLKPGGTVNSAVKQAISTNFGPGMGPIPTFGVEAATGVNPHGLYSLGQGTGVRAPLTNLKEAAKQLNPSVALATDPRNTEGAAAQFGKFAPRTGMNAGDIAAATREPIPTRASLLSQLRLKRPKP